MESLEFSCGAKKKTRQQQCAPQAGEAKLALRIACKREQRRSERVVGVVRGPGEGTSVAGPPRWPPQSGQSISFSAYTLSCLQSPVFQSLRSDSRSTCAVCNVQHSSVLSVKRTRTYIIPCSKTCSAHSTILPWTPGYCFPGLGKSLTGFSAAFFFLIGWPHLPPAAHRRAAVGTAVPIRVALPA